MAQDVTMRTQRVRGTDARGELARATLLDAAEQLFAERGIEAVSLRDVSAAAGQRNHSAAQYHFGDRRNLVAAVFERRMRVVGERRHALLDALSVEGRTGEVADIIAAIVIPLTEVVAESDAWYGRFLARSQWDTLAAEVTADLPVVASYRRALSLLTAALDLPDQRRRNRFDQLASLLIGTVAGWEWQGQRGARRLSIRDLQTELISTLTAVVDAPLLRRTP
jgi:AcrR family transcriptional regulator